MTIERRSSLGMTRTRSLLGRLFELPNLAHTVQALPARTFAAAVHEVGVEDAGELLALATTEQLVETFDEHLFVGRGAGEREVLDGERFAVWLEVLLEAGEDAAADRFAALDESFVAHCLGSILLVLDEDALREHLAEGDEEESRQVDKRLESALTEDLDGYLLVARQHDGWDAALALVLALDQRHRALLVRLLDRLALQSSHYLEDLEALSDVLSEAESLAEDVEAAREERRARQGYVEPQAARAFLKLARTAPDEEIRDPLTRAYFREIERAPHGAQVAAPTSTALPSALEDGTLGATAPLAAPGTSASTALEAFMQALRELSERDPRVLGKRMDELAYLVNAVLAGHAREGQRLRPKEATDAVLATVCYGAVLRARRPNRKRNVLPRAHELTMVLRKHEADLLFRIGSSALVAGAAPGVRAERHDGLLYTAEELDAACGRS